MGDVAPKSLPSGAAADWFRLGDGFLCLRSEHGGFRDRFSGLFGSCRSAPPMAEQSAVVHCDIAVSPDGMTAVATLGHVAPLDLVQFCLDLFPDRGFREIGVDGFSGRALDAGGVRIACQGQDIVVNNAEPWEWLVGNIAVHDVLRLQPELAVFHAASVAIDGKGVLMMGGKGSGKTTLALALAARGCSFLGDEMGALRLDSLEVVPMRRSVSIRSGPLAAQVASVIAGLAATAERFPDGGPRLRTPIEALFPDNTARRVPLAAIIFLRSRGRVARLEPVSPGLEPLRHLTPLPSTMWQVAQGARAVRLLALLEKTPCYWLDSGGPDSTADLLERHMGDACR